MGIWGEGFLFLKKKKICLFIWLHQVLIEACGIFICGIPTLTCGMWNLVP